MKDFILTLFTLPVRHQTKRRGEKKSQRLLAIETLGRQHAILQRIT